MVNDELIVDVLTGIERRPHEWNQGWWAERTECGTTYCFAGWATVLSGYEVAWYEDVDGPDDASSHLTNGDVICGTALKLLGLSKNEGDQLFSLPNDMNLVYRTCAELMGVDDTVLRDKVQDRLQPTTP
jgi:hypothetical protein